MKYLSCLLLVLTVYVPGADADEPQPLFNGQHWIMPKLCESWRKQACWCPDDYCRKPLPCVPPNMKGCGDDYCRKPLPCVKPNVPGCVDDYCRKTCPLFPGKLCEPWYSCGSCSPPVPRGAGCQAVPCQPAREPSATSPCAESLPPPFPPR